MLMKQLFHATETFVSPNAGTKRNQAVITETLHPYPRPYYLFRQPKTIRYVYRKNHHFTSPMAAFPFMSTIRKSLAVVAGNV